MITLPEPSLSPLQAQARDTLVMVMPQSLLSTVEAVSSIILTVLVLGLLVALVVVLLQLRSLTRSAASLTQRLEKEATPVLERARRVAENVDFITLAVRDDVQRLNESVHRLNERLKDASRRMEERVQDFSALVEVLQSEAEDLALDTAATVRGVRAGTRALANRRPDETEELKEPDALPVTVVPEGTEE